jgi:hypothetical protein
MTVIPSEVKRNSSHATTALVETRKKPLKHRWGVRCLLVALVSASAVQSQVSAYYAPQAGRWVIRDPAEEDDDRNLYRFVRNCPSHHLDSMGLRLWCVEWKAFWEAEGYSSAEDCAVTEYERWALADPSSQHNAGWWICGLPIAWGLAIYNTALFYRVESMCKKQVCVKWR